MRAHPQLLGGAGAPVTRADRRGAGLLCKDGAEGVWAAALPDGRAFAAKIDDGAGRALGPLLCAALRYWGFDGPAVDRLGRVAGARRRACRSARSARRPSCASCSPPDGCPA